MNTNQVVAIFKALGDENRIQILKMLLSGEKCACRLLDKLNITQPTLSHHMKILCDAQIVQGRKVGKWTYYSLNSEGLTMLRDMMQVSLSDAWIPEDCDCDCCGKETV